MVQTHPMWEGVWFKHTPCGRRVWFKHAPDAPGAATHAGPDETRCGRRRRRADHSSCDAGYAAVDARIGATLATVGVTIGEESHVGERLVS